MGEKKKSQLQASSMQLKKKDKTFVKVTSHYEQNVLINTPSFSLSSSWNLEDKQKQDMAIYRRRRRRRNVGITQLAAS